MASRSPYLINLEKNGIGVAVDGNFANELNVSRFFALHPELLPGPAPIVSFSGLESFVPGQLVHIRQHEHLPALKALDDHGKQTVLFTKIRSQRQCLHDVRVQAAESAPSLD